MNSFAALILRFTMDTEIYLRCWFVSESPELSTMKAVLQRRAAHIIADFCLQGTNRTVAVKLIHNSL